MKNRIIKRIAPCLLLALMAGLAGCRPASQTNQDIVKQQSSQKEESIAAPESSKNQGKAEKSSDILDSATKELPKGFPDEIPFYSGAEVIEADNFNENSYTVLYAVKADYDKVVDFYIDAFGLDESCVDEGGSYFEAIEVGDIHINGLTIEETGEAVNVYITLRDYGQEVSEMAADTEEYKDSNIMTYDTAKEVDLDKNYLQNIVPVYPDAKVIGCSIVPGTSSGFVDLLLPPDAFESAVSFYTDELDLVPKRSSTSAQDAVEFKGEIDNFKVVVLISHLLNGGNDPFIQIVVNEK